MPHSQHTHSLIDAVIFDLDGVLTDTAEHHFRAWKRLADEEGIPFTRADNDQLRGVSRSRSLALILGGREVPEDAFEAMMERKNRYYQESLRGLTPADVLPGATALLDEIREAGLKIAVASASRNAREVMIRLELMDRIDLLADGSSPGRPKPAPDLFLYAAEQLGVAPARCVVVEDAEAGIAAGVDAGMVTVGIGPQARLPQADVVLRDLEMARLSDLIRPATWRASEAAFEPARQHHYETVLSQGSGSLGTRGTLEEGYPGDRPATLIHGMWDDVPFVFTELANAPDWSALEIFVDGRRFSMAEGVISDYARHLDVRTGLLRRRLRWRPAADGPAVDLLFERFPSLADPNVMAVRLRVVPLDADVMMEVRAVLDGNVENQGFLQEGVTHWDTVSQHTAPHEASLMMVTRHTRKRLAMTMRLNTKGAEVQFAGLDIWNRPTLTAASRVPAGQALVIEKFVGLSTTRDSDDPLSAARATAQAALDAGYDQLRAASEAAWAAFWEDSDVVIEGDPLAQQAIRHALFQLRTAAPDDDERASIGAKALSGFGYRAHIFWDTETFMLPFFIYTQPALARNMLMYRWHTLDGARRNAAAGGFAGARYPWESAETGDEVTPSYLPDPSSRAALIRIWTGDIELHISADIAYAIWQYWQVTGDDEFMQQVGARIILETAKFWGERVTREGERYVLRDVIGPDEYHEHVDNNVYTNRMVVWHLEKALEVREWLYRAAPEAAQALDRQLALTPESATTVERHMSTAPDQLAHWQDIIEHMVILEDPDTGLMEQFEGFFDLKQIDWPAYAGRTASLQALLGVEETNRYQVLKQPDVILLLVLLRDVYDERTWRVNWDYYAPRTDHTYGSSLGPAIHAWAAAEMGDTEGAYSHFMRGARMDLDDTRGNAGDGIHAASAGGLWQALAFGFAGLRIKGGKVTLSPRLPAHWERLAFRFYLNGERQQVDVRAGQMEGQPG